MIKQKTYTFTLVCRGLNEITTELEDTLFESGCNDALLHSKNSTIFLEFDRKANSLKQAIISAIQDVEKNKDIEVAVVEPADFVTIAEIARRSGRSREYMRKLVNGERGPGGFPTPIAGTSTKTLIYSWLEVSTWLTHQRILKNQDTHRIAFIIKRLNDGLDIRRNPYRGDIPIHLLNNNKSIKHNQMS